MDSWRTTNDPRRVYIYQTIDRLITDAVNSGDAGTIRLGDIPYWQNGLGMFEPSRTVKKDLSKVGGTR